MTKAETRDLLVEIRLLFNILRNGRSIDGVAVAAVLAKIDEVLK